jgi:hypothetical protein
MAADVVLIGSTGLGSGSSELGGLILANFLRILGEREQVPGYIILWNDGVKIALGDSLWINHLKKLDERGVRIISCRTCIEYFGLEGKTSVGEIGTMPQIQELLLANQVLTV